MLIEDALGWGPVREVHLLPHPRVLLRVILGLREDGEVEARIVAPPFLRWRDPVSPGYQRGHAWKQEEEEDDQDTWG